MRTLIGIENNIIGKLNGVKLEYSRLLEDGQKYIHGRNFCEKFGKMPASRFIYGFTGTEIPEECVRAVYYIPTEKPENYQRYYNLTANGKIIGCAIPKEVLVFIGSSDGVNADYVCPIFPPYLSIETMDGIMAKIRD